MYKQEIKWTVGDGREMNVTVEIGNVKKCEIKTTAMLDGEYAGDYIVDIPNHPVVAAKIGPVGIKHDQYEQIKKAIAEAKKTPEWTEKMRKDAEAEKHEREYQKHCKVMSEAMGV